MRPYLSLLVAAAVFFSPGSARADFIFYATLTGAQEVPPNGSTATGFATFVLNDAMTALSYDVTIFGLDFTGTQTPGTADNLGGLHLHRAPFGVNGPIVFGIRSPNNDTDGDQVVTPFAVGVGGRITGIWDGLEGNAGATLTTQLPFLFRHGLYLNAHTPNAFPGGEIRGQVVPEPTSLACLGLGVLAVAAVGVRRRQAR